MFERDANGAFLPPESYPADALVTFNTHDLPTFAGWLAGRDLEIKRLRGVDPGESGNERENARRELRSALQGIGVHASGNMRFGEIIRFLARTRARLLAVSLEDAVGAVEQINMPGTVSEYPNWRHRLPVAIEDIEANPAFQEVIGALTEERGPSRPVPPPPA
jgi:4-alpha-glucanotransferase